MAKPLLLQEMRRDALPALREAADKGDEKAAALLRRLTTPGS